MIISWIYLIISVIIFLITFLFIVDTKRLTEELKLSESVQFKNIEKEIKNWLKTPTKVKPKIALAGPETAITAFNIDKEFTTTNSGLSNNGEFKNNGSESYYDEYFFRI